MEISELQKILSLVGSFGVGALLGAGIIFLFIKSFLPSYLSEKGKNLATKEDIETITDKVESVKTDYTKVIEELRSNNQLKLAEIEREKNIKKEVYLEAVEAITRSHIIVASLSNLNIDEQTFSSKMTADAGLIAKIQIVGSEETVKSVTNFMASVATATLDLMLERSILVDRKNTIDLLENYRTKAADEIDRYIAMMKNINLEGIQDHRLWDTINNNIEFEKEQRDKYAQEISDLWEMQNKEHLEFTKKCMDYFYDISSLLPETVLSVRDELNLKISREAYLDIFKKNIEKGKLVFDDFFNKISSKQA